MCCPEVRNFTIDIAPIHWSGRKKGLAIFPKAFINELRTVEFAVVRQKSVIVTLSQELFGACNHISSVEWLSQLVNIVLTMVVIHPVVETDALYSVLRIRL